MSDPSTRALWLAPPHRAFIRGDTLGPLAADHLRVRTRFSAISKGTETLVYAGGVPESEYARMAAPFQAGRLPDAVRHGYANVGVVEDGPTEWINRVAFCLFGHQTRYDVPIDAVVALPDHVPSERAVLAANMETAVNALWDAGPRVGDRISIVGAGVLGALVALLAGDIPGVHVELIDIDTGRAALARALGVAFDALCLEHFDGHLVPASAHWQPPVVYGTERTLVQLAAFREVVSCSRNGGHHNGGHHNGGHHKAAHHQWWGPPWRSPLVA